MSFLKERLEREKKDEKRDAETFVFRKQQKDKELEKEPAQKNSRVIGQLRVECLYSQGWKLFQKCVIHSVQCHRDGKEDED